MHAALGSTGKILHYQQIQAANDAEVFQGATLSYLIFMNTEISYRMALTFAVSAKTGNVQFLLFIANVSGCA